jgi:hypothetical protein
MEIGMLWYDDSSREFVEKIDRAVSYYREKYGVAPTLCLVHPTTLPEKVTNLEGLEVRRVQSVQPGHFWVGVADHPQRASNGKRKAA